MHLMKDLQLYCKLSELLPTGMFLSMYVVCPANQYAQTTDIMCSDCPDNSESPAGSQLIANCVCQSGFVRRMVGGNETCVGK